MITEKDRILALILICAEGPVAGQAEAKGWTAKQVAYGNDVLRILAHKIREGMHNTIEDRLVKIALAGNLERD